MVDKIKAVHMGVGAIGSRIVRHIVNEREGIEYVGAIDVLPEIVGKDLGEVADVGKKLGVKVSDKTKKVLKETKPDILVHTTTSFIKDVFPQIETPIKQGVDVISTCEQLSYPTFADKDLTKKYDKLAKEHDVTVLGTGINPGFLMDVRPFVLSTGCTKVNKIKVTRRMNASPRRKPFQKKIGATMTPDEFRTAIKEGKITGHVGLEESVSLIADSLGWKLDKIKVEDVDPVIADEEVSSKFYSVKPDHVKGTSQKAYGVVGGEKKISLIFKAFLGAEPSYDEVIIDGTPEVNAKISPCWHGDYGTVAMVVNNIPVAINAPPGVLTMMDVVPISFKSGNLAKFV
ncbi:MAG: dihydrodipicolinate reductase [Candidatus Korarchaeota archaeon]|nr:dihydrodipicolinate reductase [Candidatus Korarchaeota archaeon]NIU84539.1 dihydrodipicolinate reductase [Candidatus Thorarchaeota archaeon]NIW14606.1 dihydrodipicolinate reductase [Candidatus Thorarchaeota archaeon]NIW52678.1 dihydrodipicolinate reductase [Candidatus Korarchaeota archaeon]